ncbi:MAG: alpha-amylase family glycosyl hydrolase [Nitrospiraceae bacterium]|nr:alpha-amylase family glycosyl hydrolase [Nitrospiraceae bacterium]
MEKVNAHKENPRLYEINTAPWLSEIAERYGKRFTIGAVPGAEWDALQQYGFDYVWLMGIWKRSKEGTRIFRQSPEWPPFKEYLDTILPGWKDDDVIGSAYSIAAYEPDPSVGTWEDITKARAELHKRGMGLILDFVPNHTAPDHPWVSEHPDYYFMADRSAFEQNPSLYSQIKSGDKTLYIARGKDPNFPPWSDTAQLDYFNPALRKALVSEIKKIAGYCDGLRCDMAMLVLNDIFARNWEGLAKTKNKEAVQEKPEVEFWQQARAAVPGSILMAEAYWDTEWRLMEMGFDYMYDKILYDRLRYSAAHDIRLHLQADVGYQKKMVRFMENHDEPRSAEAFGPDRLRAAATLFSTLPGMKLYYHGQLEGKKIKLPVQLARTRAENPEKELQAFYERLLSITSQDSFHAGQWMLKAVFPFADGSDQNLIAYTWKSASRLKLVVINFDGSISQGRVPLKEEIDSGKDYLLIDELNGREYERKGADMADSGLHVILNGYQAHIFDIISAR